MVSPEEGGVVHRGAGSRMGYLHRGHPSAHPGRFPDGEGLATLHVVRQSADRQFSIDTVSPLEWETYSKGQFATEVSRRTHAWRGAAGKMTLGDAL